MTPLFETIVNYIPAPTGDPDANTQILISTITYNEYVGRIGIGKVDNGKITVSYTHLDVYKRQPVMHIHANTRLPPRLTIFILRLCFLIWSIVFLVIPQ